MPQASKDTRDKFNKYFGKDASDYEALEYLDTVGLNDTFGVFFYTDAQYSGFSEKTKIAIKYLCDEWDYGTDYPL